MMAAATSECSSGCQSGWTTYLDDDNDHYSSSRSCGTARSLHGKAAQHHEPYYYFSEEDDLSMISDASSGPLRQQCSAGNNVVEGGAASNAAERRGRRVDALARRQSKKAAALLEDTASSPAFFGYSKATSLSGEANGHGDPVMEIGNAADISCAFSATTGFKVRASPRLNGTAFDGYLQMQYSSPAAVKPTMPTRQVCRDVGETKMW